MKTESFDRINDNINDREGNGLIAEFMGVKNEYKWHGQYARDYHSSWDFIMPVIEKIESLELKGIEQDKEVIYQFTISIENNQCLIHRDFLPQYWGTETDFLNLYDCHKINKIESVWLAIIEFIKWFNSNKILK
jgi:hypothetical protein